jgi:hypothetical protein
MLPRSPTYVKHGRIQWGRPWSSPEHRIEVDERELGHLQAERACELPRDHFGEERLASLTGAAELQDVDAVVAGSDPPSRSGVTYRVAAMRRSTSLSERSAARDVRLLELCDLRIAQ